MSSQPAAGPNAAKHTERSVCLKTKRLVEATGTGARPRWRAALMGVALVLTGCTGTGAETELPDGLLEADAFIDTYVDLRIAALTNVDGEITEAERDSVLTARGVRSDQMLEFAEIHGRRAAYMQNVWDSVEVRFQRRRDELNREAAGR